MKRLLKSTVSKVNELKAPDILPYVPRRPFDKEKIDKQFVLDHMLDLTSYCFPTNYEAQFFGQYFASIGAEKDEFGNYFLRNLTESGDISPVLFCAHMDTANSEITKTVHLLSSGERYLITDGKSILGADDRSGMFVLLTMFHRGVPGTYAFFVGEESGRIGSECFAKTLKPSGKNPYKAAIAFDRFGTGSIISKQMCYESCSQEFVSGLDLLFTEHGLFLCDDPGGVYTDTYSFLSTIPECTNISVGYMNQHTPYESQDLLFLVKLTEVAVKLSWDKLPFVREPKKSSSLVYGGYSFGSIGKDFYDDYKEDSGSIYYDDYRDETLDSSTDKYITVDNKLYNRAKAERYVRRFINIYDQFELYIENFQDIEHIISTEMLKFAYSTSVKMADSKLRELSRKITTLIYNADPSTAKIEEWDLRAWCSNYSENVHALQVAENFIEKLESELPVGTDWQNRYF